MPRVTEKSITRILRKWRPLLGIDGRWSIVVKVFDDEEEWPHKGAVAAVNPSPGYFQATIHLNATAAEEDAHSLEHILLHELVHIVLCPITTVARDGLGEDHETTWRNMMEAATEQLTRALLRKKEIR